VNPNYGRPCTPNYNRPHTPTGNRPLTPSEYHIPPTAWALLSPEARLEFLTRRDEILKQQHGTDQWAPTVPVQTSTPAPVGTDTHPLPKQYSAPAEKRTAHAAVQNSDTDSDDNLDANTRQLVVEDYLAQDPRNHRHAYMTTRSIRTPNMTMLDLHTFVARNPPGTYYAISNAGADANIIGDGWYVSEYMSHRKANIVGFDEKIARKNGLHIVCAYPTVILPNGCHVLLRAHEVVYNKGSSFTLLSKYQCRNFGCIVDSVAHTHRLTETEYGTQCFKPPSLEFTIPFELRGCLMAFQHYLSTCADLETLTAIDITSAKQWNPDKHYASPFALPALHTTHKLAQTSVLDPIIDPATHLDDGSHRTPPADLPFDLVCPNDMESFLPTTVHNWHSPSMRLLPIILIQHTLTTYRPRLFYTQFRTCRFTLHLNFPTHLTLRTMRKSPVVMPFI